MSKSLLMTVLAGVAAVLPIASASAAGTTDPLAGWVAQVNKQIDNRAQLPDDNANGVARVTFRRGPDGRAVDITAEHARSAVARAGVRTVKLLRNLPPLPAGFPADQQIVMNFLVGGPGDYAPFETQRNRMLASGAVNNVKLASLVSHTQVAALDRR